MARLDDVYTLVARMDDVFALVARLDDLRREFTRAMALELAAEHRIRQRQRPSEMRLLRAH